MEAAAAQSALGYPIHSHFSLAKRNRRVASSFGVDMRQRISYREAAQAKDTPMFPHQPLYPSPHNEKFPYHCICNKRCAPIRFAEYLPILAGAAWQVPNECALPYFPKHSP
ncbi:hypothetical protein D1872_220850 [compost metagenome]